MNKTEADKMGVPMGWMGGNGLQNIGTIVQDFKGNSFNVLEIGSFVGRSTKQWFPKTRKDDVGLPTVTCVDMFDYKMIPQKGRTNLEALGYTVNWDKADMLEDFYENLRDYEDNVRAIKGKFPYEVTLNPRWRFDVVFIDTNRSLENMRATLKAVRPHCVPYSTLICGPHYDSEYAPELVTAVNEFVNQHRISMRSWESPGFWGFKLNNL